MSPRCWLPRRSWQLEHNQCHGPFNFPARFSPAAFFTCDFPCFGLLFYNEVRRNHWPNHQIACSPKHWLSPGSVPESSLSFSANIRFSEAHSLIPDSHTILKATFRRRPSASIGPFSATSYSPMLSFLDIW